MRKSLPAARVQRFVGRRFSRGCKPVPDTNTSLEHVALFYPMYFERTYAVELYHVAFRHRKMMHAFGHYHVRSCRHVPAGIHVEFVTGSDTEDSREHSDIFVDIVPM